MITFSQFCQKKLLESLSSDIAAAQAYLSQLEQDPSLAKGQEILAKVEAGEAEEPGEGSPDKAAYDVAQMYKLTKDQLDTMSTRKASKELGRDPLVHSLGGRTKVQRAFL